jgi:hypothetical protein
MKKQAGEALQSQANQFDKAILTLAAGALALSLTFIKDIAPHPDALTVCLLAGSWICFISSVAMTLVSHRFSILAFRRHDEVLNILYSNPKSDRAKLKNRWIPITEILNYASLIAFIVGAAFLASSAYHGLRMKECNVSDEKGNFGNVIPSVPPATPHVQRGAIPASPPEISPAQQSGEFGSIPTSPPVNGPETPAPETMGVRVQYEAFDMRALKAGAVPISAPDVQASLRAAPPATPNPSIVLLPQNVVLPRSSAHTARLPASAGPPVGTDETG